MSALILIVDDDETNLILTGDLLRVRGYEVAEARNGQEAIDMARARIPSLILMDIQMPIMSGIDATRALKADPLTADIPVIALTASAMQAEQEEINACGVRETITKPIDVKSFVKHIDLLVGPKTSASSEEPDTI